MEQKKLKVIFCIETNEFYLKRKTINNFLANPNILLDYAFSSDVFHGPYKKILHQLNFCTFIHIQCTQYSTHYYSVSVSRYKQIKQNKTYHNNGPFKIKLTV